MIFAGFGVICFLVGTMSMCISGIGTTLGIIKPDVDQIKQRYKDSKEAKKAKKEEAKEEKEDDTEETTEE